MEKSKKPSLNRRGFLKGAAKGAAVGAAALVAKPLAANAEQAPPSRTANPLPSARQLAADTAPVSTHVEVMVADRPGSDFMVDVLRSLDFEYIAANPGSSFRSLQESFVNYGGNTKPEWLTCLHEESSVFMATGYSKTAGKPLLNLAHSTVGLQHASAGVYDAFAAHTPVYIVLGNIEDVPARRPNVEWNHSAQDAAAMCRDYTKWDDNPISLRHFAESAIRAYKIAMTPPGGPVILIADLDLQENPLTDAERANLRIPKLTLARPPAGDSGSIAELASLLVKAENPLILGGYAISTAEGQKNLIELAELLQAPVSGGKFPSRHPLAGGQGLVRTADLIVGLDVADMWGTVNNFRDQLERSDGPIIKPGTKLVTMTSNDLYLKSNYQNFNRYTEVDMAIAADPEASLPSLIEAVKKLITPDRKAAFEARGKKLAEANAQAYEQAKVAATYGWDASPISTSRLAAELWQVMKGKDWASVGTSTGRFWNLEKHYQSVEGGGSACVGSALPTAVGAALAHRKFGRFCVNINNDGDFNYAPGALWTAQKHKIPLLTVMHNNRAYHQEVMHLQRMCNRHQRGLQNAGVGCAIDNPNINYAMIAKGYGMYAEGPISDPKELGPALKRAAEVVARGEPALVDAVTQPR